MWGERASTRPIVFAGPSLARLPAPLRERIDLRPPVRRDDLTALLKLPPGRAVIIDGLFGQSLAVTPTECRELLLAGWTLWGASSMGALRASELWSLGMMGVGDIYLMMRSGVVTADDEVAVGYHPDTHEELTASLVHVRAVLSRLERKAPRARRRGRPSRRRAHLLAGAQAAAALVTWAQAGMSPERLESAARWSREPLPSEGPGRGACGAGGEQRTSGHEHERQRHPHRLDLARPAGRPSPAAAPRVVDYFHRNQEHFAPWAPPRPTGYHAESAWRERLAAAQEQQDGRGTSLRLMLLSRTQAGQPVVGDISFHRHRPGAVHGVLPRLPVGPGGRGPGRDARRARRWPSTTSSTR